MWLQVDEPGIYKGNCAEFCGKDHYIMLIEVHALEPGDFYDWLADEQTTAGLFVEIGQDLDTPLPSGNAERGVRQAADRQRRREEEDLRVEGRYQREAKRDQ